MNDREQLPVEVEAAKRALFVELTGALAVRTRRRRARRAVGAAALLALIAGGLFVVAPRHRAVSTTMPEWFSFADKPTPVVDVVRGSTSRVDFEALDDRQLIAEFAKDGDYVGIVRTENRVMLVGR